MLPNVRDVELRGRGRRPLFKYNLTFTLAQPVGTKGKTTTKAGRQTESSTEYQLEGAGET